MKRYKGKYRNQSRRLRGWDYSGNGIYFITINTHGRECHFGEIVDGKMILNDFGKIAINEWFKSFEMREELSMGDFILMPNHLHAIVGLELESGYEPGPVGTHGRASLQVPNETVPNETVPNETVPNETVPNETVPNETVTNKMGSITEPKNHEKPEKWMNQQPQPFQRRPKSISSFIAGYKSAVLNKIDDLIDERQIPMQKFNRRNPLWQANYYDHVIRDGRSYEHIAEYIRKNPEEWNDGEMERDDGNV